MGKSMKLYKNIIIIATAVLLLVSANAVFAQTKLAQTGMKFLSVSTDARASAMGEAYTALHSNSSAMFYNPAGMANLNKMVDVSFGQTSWIADINYMHASAAFIPNNDINWGVFGVSVLAVDYGDLQGTVRASNEQGYLDVGTFSPIGLMIGVGYAKMLSEKFSIGGNIKYVKQSMGAGIIGFDANNEISEDDLTTDAMAFDFGVIYWTGYKQLKIGMSVRNFSQEIEYIEEGFQLPLTFRVGASFDMVDVLPLDKENHSILVAVDASHPRDFKEQIFLGGEYMFMKTFSVRAGYSFPQDERGFSAGVGVQHDLAGLFLAVDYAYAPFGVFDNVHRITINIGY